MKISRKLGVLSFIVSLLCSGYALPSHAATTLTYASNGSENTFRGEAEKLFLDEIEKQSNGKIKVTAFWSDTLVSAPEALKAVSDGVVDMAFINPLFYPKALPFWNAIALNPFGPTKGQQLVELYTKLYNEVPALKADLAKHRQFAAFIFMTDSYSFVSRTKLESVEQLAGQKSRCANRWKLADINAIKGTPVSIPWSKCYMSLQTGTIDNVLTSLESNHRGKLYEVAPYLWVWDKMWCGSAFLITMNQKKFDKLDKDMQEAIIKAGQIASQKFAEKFDMDIALEIEDMEKKGTTVTYAKDSDYEIWAKLPSIEANFQTWIEEAQKDNLPDAENTVNQIRKIVESYL